MVGFIEEERAVYGVEPMCAALPIAPATYYEHRARRLDPDRRSEGARRDDGLRFEIERVSKQNFSVYGARRCGDSFAVRQSTWRAARWSG